MKIVNLQQFLAMPEETLFSKYEPCHFDGLEIKVGNCGERDFITQQIADAIECHDIGDFAAKLDDAKDTGVSLSMDFNMASRDGCFEGEQLFAVWERADLEALIKRLQVCLVAASTRR